MSLSIIRKLKPAKFKYNEIHQKITNSDDKDDKFYLGFMAQDLLKIFGTDFAIVKKNKENNYYMVDYLQLIAPLVKSIQELDETVNLLQEEIKEIKTNVVED